MSSISAERLEGYSAFFERLASVAGASNADYFPAWADASVATYYRTREPDASHYVSEFDALNLAAALTSQWSDRPELLELIPDLVALYEKSAGEDGEDGGEVSPFIYEMF